MRALPFVLSVCLAVPAFAQLRRDRAEKPVDHRALRQDARQSRDDWRDAAALGQLLQRFDAARAANDVAGLAAVQNELRRRTKAELAEGAKEKSLDAQELRQDRREKASDRHELAKDAVQGKPVQAVDDRRVLRDDRRDLRDDRRDLAQESAAQARVRALDAELAGLVGKVDLPSLDRTRAVIVELQGLAAKEVGQNGQERREDRRELREDRRETREDRRQTR